MDVHVVGLWRVELHDALVLVPEQAFYQAHFVPRWGSVVPIGEHGHGNVLPRHFVHSGRCDDPKPAGMLGFPNFPCRNHEDPEVISGGRGESGACFPIPELLREFHWQDSQASPSQFP